MPDISKVLRAGRLSSAPVQKVLEGKDGKDPFIFFDMESDIELDGSIRKEVAKVLLKGEEICRYWEKICPTPAIGTEIRVNSSLCYVNQGVMCIRCTAPDQIEVAEKGSTAAAQFGLKEQDFIDAQKYFLRHRKKQ